MTSQWRHDFFCSECPKWCFCSQPKKEQKTLARSVLGCERLSTAKSQDLSRKQSCSHSIHAGSLGHATIIIIVIIIIIIINIIIIIIILMIIIIIIDVLCPSVLVDWWERDSPDGLWKSPLYIGQYYTCYIVLYMLYLMPSDMKYCDTPRISY